MMLTLLFNLGEELYGLEVAAIQEVLEDARRHFLPQASEVLTSAINFHGRILPVIDLPRLLGFVGSERDARLLVLTQEHHSLALEVTGVHRIVALDTASQQQPPAGSADAAVRGVVCHEDSLINLLDTDEITHLLQQRYMK